ncbi:unnamed protein product [Heterobilharzia americana]|nr:unnamed protein product [Heterobilharzia americana]
MDSRNEEKNKEDEVLVLESENVGEEVLDTTCTEKPKRDYENENQNDQVDLMEVHGSESSEGHLFDDVENIVVLKEAGKSAPGSDAAHEDEINAVSELFNLDTNLTSSNPNLKEDYYGKTEGTEAFAEDTLGQRSETSEPQVPTLQKELVTESCLSPKDAGEFKGEEDELTKEEEKKRHEELMEQYKLSIGEQKAARELNLQLQTKLAEYFRRKKVDTSDPLNSTSSTGGSATDVSIDYEQRFARYISSLADLHHQYDEMKTSYSKQIEELKILSEKRQQEVNEAYKEFMNFKYSIGKEAVHSQTGKPINPKELTLYLKPRRIKRLC